MAKITVTTNPDTDKYKYVLIGYQGNYYPFGLSTHPQITGIALIRKPTHYRPLQGNELAAAKEQGFFDGATEKEYDL